jgi:hypothetical protein
MSRKSQIERRPYYSCLRKETVFSSLEQARQKIEVLEREKYRIGLEAYKCDFCPGYHIGHAVFNGNDNGYRNGGAKFVYFAEKIVKIAAKLGPQNREVYKTLLLTLNLHKTSTLEAIRKGRETKTDKMKKDDIRKVGIVFQQADKSLRRIFGIELTRLQKLQQWKKLHPNDQKIDKEITFSASSQ